MLDLVEPRENLRRTLRNLLALHARAATGAPDGAAAADRLPETDGQAPVTDPDGPDARAIPGTSSSSPATSSARARSTTSGFVFDEFQELHGDRLFEEDAAIVGGLARLGELPVMRDRPPEGPHDERDDGAQLRHARSPRATARRMRLMRYAARFGMPIVTLVDTPGRLPRHRRRGARPVDRDRRVDHADVAAAGADRHRRDRRGRQRRRAGAGGRRPRADDGERLLLGDQPRGLRDDPVQGRRRGAARGRRAADHRARPAARSGHGRRRARARGRRPHRSRRRRREPEGGARRRACASCCRSTPERAARAALRPLPHVRRARAPAGTSARSRRAP